MGAALCTGLGSPDFILEATRMAGIFSRGFGFPSTSLEAAAEATAKGSAGSRAGAGLRPERRPPPAEGKKNKKERKQKIPGSGISEQSGELAFAVREPGGGLIALRSAGPTWPDAAAGFHAPPVWPVQGFWVLGSCCLLRFSSWDPEAWTPILTCHCISEVRRPRSKRGGGDPRLPLRGGCGCEPAS